MSAPASATMAIAIDRGVPSRGADPRTKVVLVVLVSSVVMAPGGLRYVPAALVLALGLAAWERAWRRALGLTGAAALLWALGWLLPLWWVSPVTAIGSIASAYLIRFVVAIGVGMHLIATTSPTQLAAAFRISRVPRPIAVTMAVMLRFFPVVMAEAAAVVDAMRLRGLTGVRGFIAHPILSMERFAVPMIAASLRASEDLSASAILRGLGSPRQPTAIEPPRFTATDLLLTLTVAGLAAAALLLPSPLT